MLKLDILQEIAEKFTTTSFEYLRLCHIWKIIPRFPKKLVYLTRFAGKEDPIFHLSKESSSSISADQTEGKTLLPIQS